MNPMDRDFIAGMMADARERNRRNEIGRTNRNKPMSDLVCPNCYRQGTAFRDREWNEHPGIFTCRECDFDFCA